LTKKKKGKQTLKILTLQTLFFKERRRPPPSLLWSCRFFIFSRLHKPSFSFSLSSPVPASSSPSNRHRFPALSSTPFHHFPFISHSRPLPLHSLTQGSRLPSLPPHKPLLPSHKFFLRFLLPFSLLPLNRFHRLPFSSAKKPRAASPSLPKNRDRSPLPSVSSFSSRFQHLLLPSPASSSPSSAAEQPLSGSNRPAVVLPQPPNSLPAAANSLFSSSKHHNNSSPPCR